MRLHNKQQQPQVYIEQADFLPPAILVDMKNEKLVPIGSIVDMFVGIL